MTGEAETPPLFHESDLQQEEQKVIYMRTIGNGLFYLQLIQYKNRSAAKCIKAF